MQHSTVFFICDTEHANWGNYVSLPPDLQNDPILNRGLNAHVCELVALGVEIFQASITY